MPIPSLPTRVAARHLTHRIAMPIARPARRKRTGREPPMIRDVINAHPSAIERNQAANSQGASGTSSDLDSPFRTQHVNRQYAN